MGLTSPVTRYTETQGFTARAGAPPGGGGHPGVDLAAPLGTPVLAPASGSIAIAGYDPGGFGNWIVEHLANGWYAIFGHLSAENVSAGQQVAQGQQIGAVGSTGMSTGPHLHYQLETGVPGSTSPGVLIDPQPFLSTFAGGPSTAGGGTPGAGGDVAATATLTSAPGATSASSWPAGQLTVVPGYLGWPGIHIAKATLFRVALMVVGLILLLIALKAIAGGDRDAGPISLTRDAAKGTANDAADPTDGPSNVPPSRLQSDTEATQRWELLNRQHKAQTAIYERHRKTQAQDETDELAAHSEAQERGHRADTGYQERAHGFERNAADRKRHSRPVALAEDAPEAALA